MPGKRVYSYHIGADQRTGHVSYHIYIYIASTVNDIGSYKFEQYTALVVCQYVYID